MRYSVVDVFAAEPFKGNPVAVVHDADGWATEQCAAFARWTNLSETTFLSSPTDPDADYRLRIFTLAGELPFAGHPTLGSARAWLAAGGVPRTPGRLRQECGAGLVEVRVDGDELAFAAPPLTRDEEPTPAELAAAVAYLGIAPGDVLAARWVVNGPQWLALELPSADDVLALSPTGPRPHGMEIGVVGPHAPGGPADFEVRAFCPEIGVGEDPVTGSLNAGIAQWFFASARARGAYTVAQGTALGRAGRLRLHDDGAATWVGGRAEVRVAGELAL